MVVRRRDDDEGVRGGEPWTDRRLVVSDVDQIRRRDRRGVPPGRHAVSGRARGLEQGLLLVGAADLEFGDSDDAGVGSAEVGPVRTVMGVAAGDGARDGEGGTGEEVGMTTA